MSLSNAIDDREFDKFVETKKGTSVSVKIDGEYEVNDFDDIASVSYAGKSNGISWLITKSTDGAGQDFSVRYATIENNPTMLTYSTAWTNRLTLIYSLR